MAGHSVGNKRALEEDYHDGDSDAEYHVRRLGESEDLVIDGETAVDDLLLAQRIAQQEEALAAATWDDSGAPRAAPRAQQAKKAATSGPSSDEAEQLQRLLKQTSELAAKIGGGEGVMEAMKAAAAAMARLPEAKEEVAGAGAEAADASEDASFREEQRKLKDILAGVDLASSSEGEEDEAQKQGGGAAARPGGPPSGLPTLEAARKELTEMLEKEEEEDDEEPGGALVVKEEALPIVDHDEGAPTIRVVQLPESLPEKSAVDRVGEVVSVVDGLLVVRGDDKGKVLDLQSVLCTADLRVVGAVADVFGPVAMPHYLVYAGGPNKLDPDWLRPGLPIMAAVGLEETSFLCDSNDPTAVREALRLRNQEAGEVDSGGSEEEMIEDDESGEEAGGGDPALSAPPADKGGKAKGKGKGKFGKGKPKGKAFGGEDGRPRSRSPRRDAPRPSAWQGAGKDGAGKGGAGKGGAAPSSLPGGPSLPPPPPPPPPPAW